MRKRPIRKDVTWLGAIDWHRRIFDALIPLRDGTGYNACLVSGTEKTVLFDTVDPTMQVLGSVERRPAGSRNGESVFPRFHSAGINTAPK